MLFTSTRLETTSRFLELQHLYRLIAGNERSLPVPPEHQTLKGYFIVGLSAYLEFSVGLLISTAVSHINSLNVARKHLSVDLLAILFDSQFKSERTLTGERKWRKRHEILTALNNSDVCVLSNSSLFEDVQNVRSSTIDLIFRLFSIRDSPSISPKSTGYMNEIRERRNAVAHGRESASEVGGRYSAQNLEDRLSTVESQVTHMITCFEDVVSKRAFIKSNYKRHYK